MVHYVWFTSLTTPRHAMQTFTDCDKCTTGHARCHGSIVLMRSESRPCDDTALNCLLNNMNMTSSCAHCSHCFHL